MNRVIHFEIPASDPEKSMSFYESVFGWKFTVVAPGQYWETNTGNGEPGINGAVMKRRDPAQPLTNAIQVNSIDAACEVIRKNGGQIVVEKTEVPGTGWLAYFKDPDGVIQGLWQMI